MFFIISPYNCVLDCTKKAISLKKSRATKNKHKNETSKNWIHQKVLNLQNNSINNKHFIWVKFTRINQLANQSRYFQDSIRNIVRKSAFIISKVVHLTKLISYTFLFTVVSAKCSLLIARTSGIWPLRFVNWKMLK